jgi:hypothetical protein
MIRVSRRGFLTLVASSAAILFRGSAGAAKSGVTVGAIRWDPWYMSQDTGARASLENTLGPTKWHGRAPNCAKIISSEKIDFGGCATQARIDQEISAATTAGLDYWAYVWYGPDHELQNAWRLYCSSQISQKIKWCMIFSSYSFFVREMESNLDRYTSYYRSNQYQKVLGGRPLLYLLHDGTSASVLKSTIATVRNSVIKAGGGNPYIVVLVGAVRGVLIETGADAIGLYSKANSAPVAGTYADLVKNDKAYWAKLASTGEPMVPTVLTGADRRPRVERPVPWEAATQKPFVGDDLYYGAGSPSAIANHVKDLIGWLKENPRSCIAQTCLIYSWDEHDEGGSTLNPSLEGGSEILDAVARILNP